MIKRENYLTKIRPFYDKDLIKVIIGMRRSGKSTLMLQIIEELKNKKIKANQIIYINFENIDFHYIKDYIDLDKYIKKSIISDEKYYLFFDEIGNVLEWEKAINSFKSTLNVSIFITGSNSDLLSGDLATHLSGRYVSFKVFPFSFKEVCEINCIDFNDSNTLNSEFEKYIYYGGLPQIFSLDDDYSIRTYISDVFDSIIVKDIQKRFNIKDIDLLNRIVEYIVSTPSQIFSAESLSKYFLNFDNKEVSKTTIYNYLEYLSKAIIINKADRYDLRGKRILSGKYKYYLTDLGFNSIKNKDKKQQLGAYLENVVYNELITSGYEVLVGNLINGEIDFIATKSNEKLYIQVTYLLIDDKVIEREFKPFYQIEDNYPKIVLSLDNFDMSQDGIIHKNIIKWLLENKK